MFDGPRLLFVPVSGAFGMGEYARSLNLALACVERWPTARVHFIISAQARYAKSVPFDHTALPSSPTFHPREVEAVIASFAPDAVIFDNAGRTAQLRAAKASGARLIYISARPRQRRKAFRLRWMRLLDEHWIAYPPFMAGGLSWVERMKLRGLQRPVVRYLDCILPESTSETSARVRDRAGVTDERYVLVVPGGGTGHPRAADAVDVFARTAQMFAERGLRTVFVAPGGASMHGDPRCVGMDLVPLPELIVLLRGADVVLTNGGDTLIQAIACGIPSVAVPIAADQPARIARCVKVGVARESRLDVAAMSAAVFELWDRPDAAEGLRSAARQLGLRDGLRESVDALAAMLRPVMVD